MTDLVIGEHYAWKGRCVKLLATGAVLKNYQHKGVQVEVAGHGNTTIIETLSTRELTSTWEDFTGARAMQDREEYIKRHELHRMQSGAKALREVMEQLGLYDPEYTILTAYRGYAILTFENAKQMEKLTHVLQTVSRQRGA